MNSSTGATVMDDPSLMRLAERSSVAPLGRSSEGFSASGPCTLVDDEGYIETALGSSRWTGFSVMRSPDRGHFKDGRRIASGSASESTVADTSMPWLRGESNAKRTRTGLALLRLIRSPNGITEHQPKIKEGYSYARNDV